LVRLWLLAKKLDIRGGLMDDIVERVLEVTSLGNCVPGREVVWLLWEGVEGSSEHLKGKLRQLVIDFMLG
jgi:hypothetical protein